MLPEFIVLLVILEDLPFVKEFLFPDHFCQKHRFRQIEDDQYFFEFLFGHKILIYVSAFTSIGSPISLLSSNFLPLSSEG